jgi:anti-anti-sigma factor
MNFHEEGISREFLFSSYLRRKLDAAAAEAFESHYLECDRCFEDLSVTELMMWTLEHRRVDRRTEGDVTLISFGESAELVHGSHMLEELVRNVLEQPDSKVAIDLSRVSRIDSTGLGELMRMHSHLIRERGALKVFSPTASVKRMLSLTRIDTVLETFADESTAVRSFSG